MWRRNIKLFSINHGLKNRFRIVEMKRTKIGKMLLHRMAIRDVRMSTTGAGH
jgi:hypothetical protein